MTLNIEEEYQNKINKDIKKCILITPNIEKEESVKVEKISEEKGKEKVQGIRDGLNEKGLDNFKDN